ncbi:hypothetical protein [Tardiphaga sp. 862_B3_N1_1]|uniref:hypothetical protein n=1 Tax=Tardiphaga sp. 862_B3_N1_1 TaxID=3240763 RepID=UPI003F8B7E88
MPAPVVVSADDCIRQLWGLCIVVPAEGKGGIFGFAEFVQAFALLALIFTLSGVRYQFRVDTAPVRLWPLTYWSSGVIGLCALVSDFWFAQHYPLPRIISSQAYWQFVLGFLFISLALIWLWYAYIRPPTFGRANAYNFTRAVYRYVMQGVESDLPVIADELERSARPIIKFASSTQSAKHIARRNRDKRPSAGDFACDLLLIIGNRRFCRHVASSAPNTAIALFQAAQEFKQYQIPISQFASAISIEALLNPDSLIYHEDAGFYSGYFGYTRPFTNTIFGNYRFVEALASNGNSPLDVDLDLRMAFSARQLEAYTRATLTTFKAALAEGAFHQNSYALNRAFGIIEAACSDIYRLAEPIDPQERSDIRGKVNAAISFINDAIDAMQAVGVQRTRMRRHDESYKWHDDYYDKVAKMIFEIIGHAASLKTKDFEGWSIQYSAIWSRISNFDRSQTRNIILFKVRRLLYEEVKSIRDLPNYANAKYLGYCLNVLGVTVGNKRSHRGEDYALRKAVVTFARNNYLWLVKKQPRVAAAVMIGTISFDEPNRRLVKTYSEGLSLVAPTDVLDLVEPVGVVEQLSE